MKANFLLLITLLHFVLFCLCSCCVATPGWAGEPGEYTEAASIIAFADTLSHPPLWAVTTNHKSQNVHLSLLTTKTKSFRVHHKVVLGKDANWHAQGRIAKSGNHVAAWAKGRLRLVHVGNAAKPRTLAQTELHDFPLGISFGN